MEREKEVEAEKQNFIDAKNEVEDAFNDMIGALMDGTVKEKSESFVDEFFNAWKEGADIFDFIEGHFSDMIDNMIKKAVMGRAIQANMQKIYEAVESAFQGDDDILTTTEADYIRNVAKEESEKMKAILEQLMKDFGIGYGSGAGGDLSSLQKGISGITEQTAGELEAHAVVGKIQRYEMIEQGKTLIMLSQAQLSIQGQLLVVFNRNTDILQRIENKFNEIITNSNNTSGYGVRSYIA